VTVIAAPVPPTGPLSIEGTPVEFVDVVKDYGPHRALRGVDLAINPGEFVSLLGPSGCGKTTALRALAGLETITSGSIRIAEVDVDGIPANRRDIGMVFQSYSLFPHMTVRENVEFGLRMRRVEKAKRRFRADEALELVGLSSFAGRFAHQLSGGQQQRVALARALVTRPRVLLLDEPLSALDAKVRVSLRDEIRRIQRELGITTVFVTHDQEEALAVSDRIAVMNAGSIDQIGTPEELYLRPATAFVADFVGLSNKLPGAVAGSVVTVYGQAVPVMGAAAEGPAIAYIRPEDIEFAADGVAGTVLSTSFLGSLRRTSVLLADGALVSVQHDAGHQPERDAPVRLRFRGRPAAVVAA